MGRFSELVSKTNVQIKNSIKASMKSDDYDTEDDLDVLCRGDNTGFPYMVDNTKLRSQSSGVVLRYTPGLDDKTDHIAQFGQVIFGEPFYQNGESWLKVGDLFCPMEVKGHTVLVPMETPPAVSKENDEGERDANKDDMWKNYKIPRPREVPPVEKGTGAMYQVIFQSGVAYRAAPSLAAPRIGFWPQGAAVELFEWDETRKWRAILDHRTNNMGWVLLDHPHLGCLLRPKGLPLTAKPREPICDAAREGFVLEVKRFITEGDDVNIIDVAGCTPLMYAAESDRTECCVLLLAARADASMKKFTTQETAIHMATSASTKALLLGLTGSRENFSKVMYEQAVAKMRREFQELADNISDQVWVEEVAKNEQYEEESKDAQFGMQYGMEETKKQKSLLYEVVHGGKGVPIRREPNSKAGMIALRKKGEVVQGFEFDETHNWIRVRHEAYEGHFIAGWMMLKHPDMGALLLPLDWNDNDILG